MYATCITGTLQEHAQVSILLLYTSLTVLVLQLSKKGWKPDTVVNGSKLFGMAGLHERSIAHIAVQLAKVVRCLCLCPVMQLMFLSIYKCVADY